MSQADRPRWAQEQLMVPGGRHGEYGGRVPGPLVHTRGFMDALENTAPADEQYHTFWYFHLNPFRRHALQIRGDGRVQLISREGDFEETRTSSGWHGESDWHHRFRNRFTVDLNCRGEESLFLRRLHVLPDAGEHLWYAYHANTHWAVLVWAGQLSSRAVQNMLNVSERERAPLRGHARDRAPRAEVEVIDGWGRAGPPAPFNPFPQAGRAPLHPPFPDFHPFPRQGGERLAPRPPSHSPPRDNRAPAAGIVPFSGRHFRLYE